jgi:hypothetical protein
MGFHPLIPSHAIMVTPGVLTTYELLVNGNIRRRAGGRSARRHIAREYCEKTVDFDDHRQHGIATAAGGRAAAAAGTVTSA